MLKRMGFFGGGVLILMMGFGFFEGAFGAVLSDAPNARDARNAPNAGDAKIVKVTVYPGLCRVTREAVVPLSGGTVRVVLPLLPAHVVAGSVRVEVSGPLEKDRKAEVLRVEQTMVPASAVKLPKKETEALLDELNAVEDKLAQLSAVEQAYAAQARFSQRLLPSAQQLAPGSVNANEKIPRLDAAGWDVVLGFVEQLVGDTQKRQRALREERYVLEKTRDALREKGRLLQGLLRQGGLEVAATVQGEGEARLLLSYVLYGTTWEPAYDLHFSPSTGTVDLSLFALLSQHTGEDWTDVQLLFSTATPHGAQDVPKFLTWKLGEKERFVPTPRKPVERIAPPPPFVRATSPVSADESRAQEEQAALRNRLFAHLEQAGASKSRTRDAYLDAPPPPPPPPPPPQGQPAQVVPADEAMAEEAPAMPKMAADLQPRRVELSKMQIEASTVSTASPSSPSSIGGPSLEGKSGAREVGVGLRPPPGYQSATTGTSAAFGEADLLFLSPAKETVPSGEALRRVPILHRSFPVQVTRKLFPALAKEAFLTALIRNTLTDPLPYARAQLSVGKDPAGVAQIKLMAPGEVVALPLGLDRALSAERNVQVNTYEKGVFSKDEVSEYVVTLEVVNPHAVPVDIELHDQIPLSGDKNVEIELLRAEPQPGLDKKTGALEWRQTLGAGKKAVVRFAYSVKRPKGYRLSQHP